MKCPTCAEPLYPCLTEDGSQEWICGESSCGTPYNSYQPDENGKPIRRIPKVTLDDEIDLTLEIFEIIPTNQKPQPDFWAEVSGLISMMDEIIERSKLLPVVSTNQMETAIQLGLMREALQRQHDIEMKKVSK